MSYRSYDSVFNLCVVASHDENLSKSDIQKSNHSRNLRVAPQTACQRSTTSTPQQQIVTADHVWCWTHIIIRFPKCQVCSTKLSWLQRNRAFKSVRWGRATQENMVGEGGELFLLTCEKLLQPRALDAPLLPWRTRHLLRPCACEPEHARSEVVI